MMFIYLYFVQGIIISFGTTMPYIYNELPNYQVMSIFATIAIPFSLKFLTGIFNIIKPRSLKKLILYCMEKGKLGLFSVK